MTRFGIDVNDAAVRDALADLEDEYTTERVEVVGSNVEYGVYLEFGTEKMQPYPWFRPAVREFKLDPEGFITDNSGFSSVEEIPDADTLVKTVASALESKMEANVSAVSASDRSPGTHPDHPKRQTGNLVNSIEAVRVK